MPPLKIEEMENQDKKKSRRLYLLKDGRLVTYGLDQVFSKEGKVVFHQVNEYTFEKLKTFIVLFSTWDNYLTDATFKGFID